MSRIADAQRRSGRAIAADAEQAWNEARAIARDTLITLDPEAPARQPMRRPDAVVARSNGVGGSAASQLTALARAIFSPPPAGAGLKQILFCSGEPSPSTELISTIAACLVADRSLVRAGVVELSDTRPSSVLAPGAELISMSPLAARNSESALTSRFDVVLFDACAVPVDPDVLFLAGRADGAVIVIDEQSTRRETARTLLEALRQAGATVLGTILSNRAYPIPPGIYQRV